MFRPAGLCRSSVNGNVGFAPDVVCERMNAAVKKKSRRRRGTAVTIHEVARKAGVSPMTVSRVTNGEDNVREATRDLVMKAIRELNYSPNPAARSLAGAQSTRI